MVEFHQGKPPDPEQWFLGWDRPIEDIFNIACAYAEVYHKDSLSTFRTVKLEDLTPQKFWSEYVWCVYTSGFRARTITQKYPRLMNAIGPWNWTQPNPWVRKRILKVFANEKKCDSVLLCRTYLLNLGWESFQADYIRNPASLKRLPFIGGVTCYHLARNIGIIDCVKPDVHLARLARYFSLVDPELMCSYLAGLSGERLGVVDFILWSYCAAFGTKDLEYATFDD